MALPADLNPALGFAFWHLSRGTSAADVFIDLRDNPHYSTYSDATLWRVIGQSQRDVTVYDQSRRNFDRNLSAMFRDVNQRPSTVGVRFLVTIQEANGSFRTIGIPVNVGSKISINEVWRLVQQLISRQGHVAGTGNRYKGTAIGFQVIGIAAGGYEGGFDLG